ncbi:MAG TPA: FKBP-type peptidyl-prolyl cis-trans isomerase [bacterium]|nr:FKBP-type peptidyl-prolyl cis-trans isomerase [bacterium]
MRIVIAALLGCALVAGQAYAQDKGPLKTDQDKVSYSIGLSVGHNLKQQDIPVEPDKFMLGLRDALGGGKQLLTDKEVKEVLFAFQMDRRAKAKAAHDKEATENKKKGEAFLAANKKKKGVHTTASGLEYKVIKQGTGATPKPDSLVTAHYRGTLLDDTVFDSSYDRGQPAQFPVSGVIPGWTEALQLMKVGSKYRVWIPPDLAYGERGAGGKIGPNETLVFDIELLKVEAPGNEKKK